MNNKEIISQFNSKGQRILKKDEFLNSGFDFLKVYIDKDGKPYFDKEDLVFAFKDFIFGNYFIKTAGDLVSGFFPNETLKFRIIRIDFSELRNIVETSIQLRRNRKYWKDGAWARTSQSLSSWKSKM